MLKKGLEAISGTIFLKLLTNCEHLIGKLQHEPKPNHSVEEDSIQKVGWAVGKTTMIDSYDKVINEVLANLGTFISNTLHVLIGEILIYLPVNSPHRQNLFHVYEVSEQVLARL